MRHFFVALLIGPCGANTFGGEATEPPAWWVVGPFALYTTEKFNAPEDIESRPANPKRNDLDISAEEITVCELTKALNPEDVKRRLKEAETFIKENQATSKDTQK